jgi:hypothetical protein
VPEVPLDPEVLPVSEVPPVDPVPPVSMFRFMFVSVLLFIEPSPDEEAPLLGVPPVAFGGFGTSVSLLRLQAASVVRAATVRTKITFLMGSLLKRESFGSSKFVESRLHTNTAHEYCPRNIASAMPRKQSDELPRGLTARKRSRERFGAG